MKNNRYQLLDKVNYPSDLKKLNDAELVDLASDIRAYILFQKQEDTSRLVLEQLSCQFHFIIFLILQKIKLSGMSVINAIHIRY